MTFSLLIRAALAASAVVLLAAAPASQPAPSFTGPLMPGQDPSLTFFNGFYYLTQAQGRSIVVIKSATLADLPKAPKVRVWTAPPKMPYSAEIWAPELLQINNKWFIYFAADDGNNDNHRMYALESAANDPTGPYTFQGKLADAAADRWAIDGTVLQLDKKLYFIWAGWEGPQNGQQNLYIAPMASPTKISGKRVAISHADQPWELISGKNPCTVNEGPEILQHDGKTFLIYSCNGYWSNDYSLGMLTLAGKDPLDPKSWHKSNAAVFTKTNKLFNVGHNSFFTSPDGKQSWLAFHAITKPDQNGRGREIFAQPFTWKKDGTPDFGKPIDPGTPIPAPAGEAAK